MLHIDPFSELDFRRLDEVRADHCVSIYLPTHTVSRETDQDKILFKNLVKEAVAQLSQAGADKRRVWPIEEQLQGLADNMQFWNHVAESLAVFVTPDSIETFRLPRTVSAEVEISDRFHIKPLIPLLAFPHTAYLLDIAQNQVRFWEVAEGHMHEVEVPDMPASFNEALEQRTGDATGDAESVNMRQDEHRKVRQRQFTRAIAEALRPVLHGQRTPLVLAGVDTMLIYYRETDTYPHTAEETISGNQEHRRHDEFAAEVRAIVSRRFDGEICARLDRVEALRNDGRSSTDVMEIARAAQEGRVESLIVDVERELYGTLSGGIGSVAPDGEASASTYDVLDELVGLTIRQGGEVIGVEEDKLPEDVKVAAIFRYAA